MIIISASMPRSASLWYRNLTVDILKAGGHANPDMKTILDAMGRSVPRNVNQLGYRAMKQLCIHGGKYSFPVKTHASPSWHVKRQFENKTLKGTYIYRDPRDVIVSALELGQKNREHGDAKRYFLAGPYKSFARFYTLEGAIKWVNWQLFPRWKKWMGCKNILTTKYEDLVLNTANEIHRLAAYLEIALSEKQIEKILAKYTTDNTGKIKDDFWRPGRGYLKNKGKIGRYKEKLSDAEQALCNQRLHRCLSMMGYK